MYDPRALNMHIDGSAFRNPGHEGGFGIIIEYPESLSLDPKEITESYKNTTNQRMELRACIRALKIARQEVEKHRIRGVLIFTDSDYVYSNQSRAIIWKKDKWRGAAGQPIENRDLWKEFLLARQAVKAYVEIQWNKGKSSGISKQVDKLAKKAATSKLKWKDVGFLGGKVAMTKTKGGGSPTPFPARGQIEIIRVYRYKGVGHEEYRIIFDLFSKEQGDFIAKHFAYLRLDKTNKKHHRHGCYKAQFNNDLEYPIIKSLEPIKCPK